MPLAPSPSARSDFPASTVLSLVPRLNERMYGDDSCHRYTATQAKPEGCCQRPKTTSGQRKQDLLRSTEYRSGLSTFIHHHLETKSSTYAMSVASTHEYHRTQSLYFRKYVALSCCILKNQANISLLPASKQEAPIPTVDHPRLRASRPTCSTPRN